MTVLLTQILVQAVQPSLRPLQLLQLGRMGLVDELHSVDVFLLQRRDLSSALIPFVAPELSRLCSMYLRGEGGLQFRVKL